MCSPFREQLSLSRLANRREGGSTASLHVGQPTSGISQCHLSCICCNNLLSCVVVCGWDSDAHGARSIPVSVLHPVRVCLLNCAWRCHIPARMARSPGLRAGVFPEAHGAPCHACALAWPVTAPAARTGAPFPRAMPRALALAAAGHHMYNPSHHRHCQRTQSCAAAVHGQLEPAPSAFPGHGHMHAYGTWDGSCIWTVEKPCGPSV